MNDRKTTLGPSAWSQILRIYDHAIGLPESQRDGYLRQVTAEVPEVRSVVERLLARATGVERFLEQPAAAKLGELPLSALVGDFAPGTRIADFEIGALLGEGGIAKVYLAQDLSLGRQVALKISPDSGEEARTIARIEHENVVQVFSQRTERALHFIAMQFVPGLDLEQVKTRVAATSVPPSGKQLLEMLSAAAQPTGEGPGETTSPVDRFDYVGTILWMGTRIADALDAAHRTGVLHSDIKPSNILLHVSGKPYVSDFNVSMSSQSLRSGKTDRIGGTVRYMAPEHRALFELPAAERKQQAMRLDETIDVYSLGKVIEELLALARVPLSEAIGAVLRKACATAPRDRMSAASLRDRLSGCLELHLAVASLPPERPFDGHRSLGQLRRGWFAGHAVAAAATVSVFALARATSTVSGAIGIAAGLATFALSTAAWNRLLRFLGTGLDASTGPAPDADGEARLRKAALAVPKKALVLGMLPAAAAYLAAAQSALWCDGLGAERAMVSLGLHVIAIGLFVGASLSLWSARPALRIYRHLWFGTPGVRVKAAAELRLVGFRQGWALALAVTIPVAFAFVYFDGARRQSNLQSADQYTKLALLVGKLYSDVLQRAPTVTEREVLVGALSSRGAPRADELSCVIYGFLQSDEALAARVAGWYRKLLRRPESVGYFLENRSVLSPWLERLADGASDDEVLSDMALHFRDDVAREWGEGDFERGLSEALGTSHPKSIPSRSIASESAGLEARVRALVRSEAYAVSRVMNLYPTYVRREALDDEKRSVFSRYWTDELARRQDEASVVAGFLASEEYTGIATGVMGGFPSAERCGRAFRFRTVAAAALPISLPISLSLAMVCLALGLGYGIAALRAASRMLAAFSHVEWR